VYHWFKQSIFKHFLQEEMAVWTSTVLCLFICNNFIIGSIAT